MHLHSRGEPAILAGRALSTPARGSTRYRTRWAISSAGHGAGRALKEPPACTSRTRSLTIRPTRARMVI